MFSQIRDEFDAYITKNIKNLEVRSFLVQHERKNVCIEKLCEQIRIAELSNIGRDFNLEKWRLCIHSVARMFAQACLRHQEEKILSDAEIARRLSESRKLEHAEEMITELEDDALDETPRSFLNDAQRER